MTEATLVCDDDIRRAAHWVQLVEQHIGTARACTGSELVDLISVLTERAETSRQQQQPPNEEDPQPSSQLTRLDGAPFLFLDFDFTPDPTAHVADEQQRGVVEALRGRTGERLAYFARSHSSAGYIVVINQHFKHSTFDLTMQRFAASFADINVSGNDMENNALWTGTTDSGEGPGTAYNPWSWPVLPNAGETTHACREIVGDLEQPVLHTLGLAQRAFHSRQLDVFTGDPDAADFRSLIGSSLGLDPKDETTDRGETTIAASVLSRWLTQVVAAQNVVSDLPHVLSRFPALAADLRESPNLKNVSADDLPSQLAENRHETLSRLIGRDVWELQIIRRLAGETKRLDSAPLAFCEDTSCFTELESAIEVETDLPGPYGRRFVQRLDGVDYLPLNRLLG